MDDGGNRQHGRVKADQLKADQFKATQGQRMTPPTQPSMKQIIALMAERDAAIHERNMAISERKAAIAERDMAFLQRDSAIAERNNAIMERDHAFETLQYLDNSMASSNVSSCTSGSQITHGFKHIPHPHQNLRQMTHMYEGQYEMKEMQTSEDIPVSPVPCDAPKSKRGRRPKEVKATPSSKKTASKSPRKSKREKDGTNDENTFGKTLEWKQAQDMVSGNEDLNKQLVKSDRKQELGHDEIVFDEKTMPPPGCSCTGEFRQCYKWGHGGWQSSCCTTSISMYPLPTLPNKRHARVGGRKMSGSAYSKLLGRLAAAGHDLSNPIDLKNHWAKHGTNRYITIK